MRFLLTRALSTGRQALLQRPVAHAPLSQRCSFLPIRQIARASLKTDAGDLPQPIEKADERAKQDISEKVNQGENQVPSEEANQGDQQAPSEQVGEASKPKPKRKRKPRLPKRSYPGNIDHSSGQTSFKAPVGYNPNKSETPPINPNIKDKIPQSKRPLKRPFVPRPTKTAEELLELLPYIIRRTPYHQLPIYRKWLSGGNRCLILVKKIEGDRTKLVEDLAAALELDRKDVRLNPTTQHVEIKGNHFEKALDWLLETGF